MKTITGKFLIRKGTMANGEMALVVAGTCFPEGFELGDVSDKDELWVARFDLVEVIKYEQRCPESTGFKRSPEDFIAGHRDCLNTTGDFTQWKKKSQT
jgi:hypothetical protein